SRHQLGYGSPLPHVASRNAHPGWRPAPARTDPVWAGRHHARNAEPGRGAASVDGGTRSADHRRDARGRDGGGACDRDRGQVLAARRPRVGVDRSTVPAWLDRYVDALKPNEAGPIAALFPDDATYGFAPFGEENIARGHVEIIKGWLDTPDPPGAR